jgi:hypothetical protein
MQNENLAPSTQKKSRRRIPILTIDKREANTLVSRRRKRSIFSEGILMGETMQVSLYLCYAFTKQYVMNTLVLYG